MGQLSQSDKAAFAAKLSKAERSENPAASTRKKVNFLLLLGDRIKPKQSISGTDIDKLINTVESRGFSIPEQSLLKLGSTELRTLQSNFDTKIAGVSLPFATRATAQPASKSKYTDQQLDQLYAKQKQMFEQMTARPDPLLILANKQGQRKVLPGKMSPEDQALYDQNQRHKRK